VGFGSVLEPGHSLQGCRKQSRSGSVGVAQVRRPLRDSLAHHEVGSPEKVEREKRTPVPKTAAAWVLCSCRGERSLDPTRGFGPKETDLGSGSKICRLRNEFFALLSE